jgi:hypothetical protein
MEVVGILPFLGYEFCLSQVTYLFLTRSALHGVLESRKCRRRDRARLGDWATSETCIQSRLSWGVGEHQARQLEGAQLSG